MTETLKVLGQINPGAATEVVLYTVPQSKIVTISSVVVCNTSSSQASFRIAIAVSGATTSVQQYLYFDQQLDANSTFVSTIGITMQATDELRVYASSSDLAFNLFGAEVG